jgi:GNAT superfamily N-acetyltransferase
MDQILRLHRSRDDVHRPEDAEHRTRLLEWLAFHNPFAGGEATYYVAEEAGTILAFQGRMPVEFLINGARRKGYYVHDTYVHPDARTRGIGFPLIAALAETTEKESDSFFCLLGGTPLNLKIQRRMGYREIPPAPQYVKFLNPRRQIKRFLKVPLLVTLAAPLVRLGLSVLDFFLITLRSQGTSTQPIDRFDQRFDRLVASIAGTLGTSAYKSSAYLNWKYVDRPFRRDTILAVEDESGVKGFIILAMTRGEMEGGVIMDIVADPGDRRTILQLCRGAVEFFRKRNAEFIRCVISDERFGRMLQKFLFVKSREGKALLLGNLERAPADQAVLTETNRWHMTLGESDAFMLST